MAGVVAGKLRTVEVFADWICVHNLVEVAAGFNMSNTNANEFLWQ
jgi:hypothetical protein